MFAVLSAHALVMFDSSSVKQIWSVVNTVSVY